MARSHREEGTHATTQRKEESLAKAKRKEGFLAKAQRRRDRGSGRSGFSRDQPPAQRLGPAPMGADAPTAKTSAGTTLRHTVEGRYPVQQIAGMARSCTSRVCRSPLREAQPATGEQGGQEWRSPPRRAHRHSSMSRQVAEHSILALAVLAPWRELSLPSLRRSVVARIPSRPGRSARQATAMGDKRSPFFI